MTIADQVPKSIMHELDTAEKICLKKHRDSIVADVEAKFVLPHFEQAGIFSKEESADVLRQDSVENKVRRLLDILANKGEYGYDVFIKALKHDDAYSWIARKLCDEHSNIKKENVYVHKMLQNGGVPFRPAHLVKRTEVVQKIRHALRSLCSQEHRSNGAVVLHGMIGCGKSILAAEALRDYSLIAECFPDGVHWLPIGKLREPNDVLLKMHLQLDRLNLGSHKDVGTVEMATCRLKRWCLNDVKSSTMDDSPSGSAASVTLPDQLPQKRKRAAISLETKRNILREQRGGEKVCNLVRKYGLSQPTVSTIIRNALKMTENECHASANHAMEDGRKRIRHGAYKDVEEALHQWFLSARAMNLPISGPILAEKAKHFAYLLQNTDFQPGGGWIQRFKERHRIVYKAVVGEAGSLDVDARRKLFEETLPYIREAYADRDLYNGDETGLFFQMLPSKTHALKGDPWLPLLMANIAAVLRPYPRRPDKWRPYIEEVRVRGRARHGSGSSFDSALELIISNLDQEQLECFQSFALFLEDVDIPSLVAKERQDMLRFLQPNAHLLSNRDNSVIQLALSQPRGSTVHHKALALAKQRAREGYETPYFVWT
ncbi:hypothetical protein V5799_011664 [Amblyomma americanum]|uniref:Uncharacterized protein n=1 Tax=Amblyomma americanum TaxID=6943 RepID=A0AAQ4EGL3_AMBAM